LIITNEGYLQHGSEVVVRNPNSPTISHKSTLLRIKHRRSGIKIRKTSVESSESDGDKDPPKKNIEKSHTIYTSSKRKRDI
jgi:hypothetical protein